MTDKTLHSDITLTDGFFASDSELANLKDLYESSFPADERRPWADIETHNGPHLITIRSDSGNVCGFFTCWRFVNQIHGLDAVYIEHFAVAPILRGHGIGHIALDELKKLCGDKPLVLEAEPDTDSELAARRLSFYARNGFEIISRDYIQPPYTHDSNPVSLYLLSTQTGIDPRALTDALHRHVYKPCR